MFLPVSRNTLSLIVIVQEKDRLKIAVSKIDGEPVPENHWSDDPLPKEDSTSASESSSK